MLPVIQLGPLAIQVPGLLLILGLWVGLNPAERYAVRRGINASSFSNLVFIALVAGLIGARLVYAVRYTSAFSASPFSLLSLNPGLLDPLGGGAIAFISALIYAQRKSISLLTLLDSFVPLLAVMMIAIGAAHLASGESFGAPTSLLWGIELWGTKRHPSQVYEIAASSLILAAFWPGRSLFEGWKPGTYFFAFAAATAGAYLFLASFRGDSVLLPGGLRQEQVASWAALAACLVIIGKLNRKET